MISPSTMTDTQPPALQNSRRSRPQMPNYKHIHRFPLPLTVHPLLPSIPHNPLSVISVLLSYLTCLISPPHHEIYSAYFDSATSSVQVTDEKTIRALWEMGFFGKGSLSRSEPSWLEREKKKRGLLGNATSEESTRKRRVERREWKLERARKEREIIAQRLKEEAAPKDGSSPQYDITAGPVQENGTIKWQPKNLADKETDRPVNPDKVIEEAHIPNGIGATSINSSANIRSPNIRSPNGTKTVRFSPIVEEKKFISDSEITAHLSPSTTNRQENGEELINEEHLQLSKEEAFFLVYGLGALRIYDSSSKSVIPTTPLLTLFCQHSYSPAHAPTASPQPDDPFMLSYVTYHHFRSLGWVVRSGVKFGVDYLLYNRGPVFAHAEFAVVILPSYERSYWTATQERRDFTARRQSRSWWWLHCVNRVQAQVKKTLVLCFVDIPPPSEKDWAQENVRKLLCGYKVREMIIKRFVPNRSRD